MSGTGNCSDNTPVETVFKTVKADLIWRHTWETQRSAEVAVFEYIIGLYNLRRRHAPSNRGIKHLGDGHNQFCLKTASQVVFSLKSLIIMALGLACGSNPA